MKLILFLVFFPFLALSAELEKLTGQSYGPCSTPDHLLIEDARKKVSQTDFIPTSHWKDNIFNNIGSWGQCTSKEATSYAYFIHKSKFDEDWEARVIGSSFCKGFCLEKDKEIAKKESFLNAQKEAIFACAGEIDLRPLEIQVNIRYITKYITNAVFQCRK